MRIALVTWILNRPAAHSTAQAHPDQIGSIPRHRSIGERKNRCLLQGTKSRKLLSAAAPNLAPHVQGFCLAFFFWGGGRKLIFDPIDWPFDLNPDPLDDYDMIFKRPFLTTRTDKKTFSWTFSFHTANRLSKIVQADFLLQTSLTHLAVFVPSGILDPPRCLQPFRVDQV